MGLISTIGSWFGGKRAQKIVLGSPDSPRVAEFIARLGGDEDPALGEPVTPQQAITLPEFMAGVRNISEDIAKLPRPTFRRLRPRGKERLYGDPVGDLVATSPNPEMTAMSFWETLIHAAIMWGNGYAEIVRNGAGRPQSLNLIASSRVEVKRDPRTRVLFYKVNQSEGPPVDIPTDDVFHLHGLASDGIVGYGIVKLASESIGYGLAIHKFGAKLFGNGTALGPVFKFPGVVRDKVYTQLREDLRARRRGLANAHEAMILQNGGDVTKLGIAPEEAQFIQSRQMTVEMFARWLRIPPHKLQHLLRSTFNNIESQNIEYVKDCLQPWAIRIEQEIQRKLHGLNTDVFTEHNFEGLLRGDSTTRANFHRTMFMIGAKSINEIREDENENPVEGGDDLFVPLNMRPLDEPPPQKPTQAPAPPDEDDTGANSIRQVAAVAEAFVPVLKAELERNTGPKVRVIGRGVAVSKAFAEENAYWQCAIELVVESLRTAICAVRGVPELTAEQLQPVYAVVAGYTLRQTERIVEKAQPEDRHSLDHSETARSAIELAASEINNVIDSELN